MKINRKDTINTRNAHKSRLNVRSGGRIVVQAKTIRHTRRRRHIECSPNSSFSLFKKVEFSFFLGAPHKCARVISLNCYLSMCTNSVGSSRATCPLPPHVKRKLCVTAESHIINHPLKCIFSVIHFSLRP